MKRISTNINNGIKRIIDLVASAGLLLFLSPVLLALCFCVRRKLGSPAIFAQERAGLHGDVFTMYKFRTMTNEMDSKGMLLPDEARLTGFGRWLRSSSLDELPELWNILKGDMSFVGPRPLLVRYLGRYSKEQARRHETRPGLTGWAQINGRNAISWQERFALDVWYVDHQSLWLDLKIVAMTAMKVLKREGISAGEHVTMEEFWGNGEKQGE